MKAAMLALVLAGCGAGQSPADTADRALVELQRVRAFIVAACTEPPIMPRKQCDETQKAYNALVGVAQ